MSNQRLGIEIAVEKVSVDPKGVNKDSLQANLDAATKGLHLKVDGFSIGIPQGLGATIQQKLNEATKGLTLNLSGVGGGGGGDFSGIEKSLSNLTSVVKRVGAGIQDALNKMNGDKARSEVQKVTDALRILDGQATNFNAKGFKFEIKSDVSKASADIKKISDELNALEARSRQIVTAGSYLKSYDATIKSNWAKGQLGMDTVPTYALKETVSHIENILGIKNEGKKTREGLAEFIKYNFDDAQKVIREEGAKLKQQMANIRLELETAAAGKPLQKLFDITWSQKGVKGSSIEHYFAASEEAARKYAEDYAAKLKGYSFNIQERKGYNETAALVQEYQKKEAILKKFAPDGAWQEAASLQGMMANLRTQQDVKEGLLPKTSLSSVAVTEAEVAAQRAKVDKIFQQAISSPEYLEAMKKQQIAQLARGSFRVEPPGTFRVTAPAAVTPPQAPTEAPAETYFKRKRVNTEFVLNPETGKYEVAEKETPKKAKAAPVAPTGGGTGGEGGGDGGEKPPKEDRATAIVKRLQEALGLSEEAAKKMKEKIDAALKMEGVDQGVTKLTKFKDLMIQINGETSKLSNISDRVKKALADNPDADITIFSRSKLNSQIQTAQQQVKDLSDKALINGVPQVIQDQLQQLRKDTGHALTNKLTSPDDVDKLKDRFLQLNAAVTNDTKILGLQRQLDDLIKKYGYLGDAAKQVFESKALTQNYGSDAAGNASAKSVRLFSNAISEAKTRLEGLAEERKKLDDAWAVRDKINKGWDKQSAITFTQDRRRDFDAIAEIEKQVEANKNADLKVMHSKLQKEKAGEAKEVARQTAAEIAQYEYEQNLKYQQRKVGSIQNTLQGRLNNVTQAAEQYNAQQARLGKSGVSYDILPVEAAIGKVKDGDTAAYAKTLIDDLKRQIRAQAKEGTFDFNLAGSIERQFEKVAQIQRDYRMLVQSNPSYQFRPLDTSIDYTKPLVEVQARAKEIKKSFQEIQDAFKLDKAANAAAEALAKSTHSLDMFLEKLNGQVITFNNNIRGRSNVDTEKIGGIQDKLNTIYGIADSIQGAPTPSQLRQLELERERLTNLMKDLQQTTSKSEDPFANIFKGIPRIGATVQELQARINELNIDIRSLDGKTLANLDSQAKKYKMTIDETTGAVRNLNDAEKQFEFQKFRTNRRGAEIDKIAVTYKNADVSGLRAMQQEIADLVQRGGGQTEIDVITHKLKLLAEAIGQVKAEASTGAPPNFLKQLAEVESIAFQRIGDLHADRKATATALNQIIGEKQISFTGPDGQEKINAAAGAWKKYNVELKNGVVVAKEANNIFSFLGDNLSKMALRLTQFYSLRYILFGVGAEFREAAAAAMKFSQNIHDIAAISGASQKEMESLGKSILEIARSTRFTSDEVAGLMQLLAQAGVSASELPVVASTVGQFASATGTKPEMAADLVTTGLNVFDIKAQDTIKVTNQLTAALNLSKLTSQGLGTAFNYLAPQAEQLGMSLKQTLGIISTMAQAGVKPSTIGTGASQLLKELSSPKPRFQNLLDYYSIKAEDVNPLNNDFADIVEKFSNATGKMGEQGVQVQHVMSALETRVGRALVTAMSLGSAAFRDMTEAIAGSNAAWIAFYKSMDGAQARMNQVKQNFQAAMIGLFDIWKPVLSGMAGLLKNVTDNMNTAGGQAVMLGASFTALAGIIYALTAAYRTLMASTTGQKFLSFAPLLGNPQLVIALGVITALSFAFLAFSKHTNAAVESLEKYNKTMFANLEALDKTQAGIRDAKMKMDAYGNEASAIGQYEQTVRKYGMASSEAMELKKKHTQVEKENVAAQVAAMKVYNDAVKKYGETSREAMAAKDRLGEIAAKGSAEETKALKAYDDAVQKHGENSKEAMILKQKSITLTDDTKVALNKLKAEYPAYLKTLDVEKGTVEDLIKIYQELGRWRTQGEQKDLDTFNKKYGPELLLKAAQIKLLKQELKNPPPSIAPMFTSGVGLPNQERVIKGDLKQAEKEYAELQTAAQPLVDRLKNANYKADTYVQGENSGVFHFGDKIVGDKKDPAITQLPKTGKKGTDNIPVYKEHYDAIAETKKAREELLTLIKSDGTTLQDLKTELEKIETLQDELEPLLIADYQNKARQKATYLDKDGKTYFQKNYAEEAEASLEKEPQWKKYYQANKDSGKSISTLYYFYQQQAAEEKARQEMSAMRASTAKTAMDEERKILGYQDKFREEMRAHLDSVTEADIASQEANLQKIISSAYTGEDRRARAVIEAKRLANEKIDLETRKKIEKAEEATLIANRTAEDPEKNLARLDQIRAELEAGGERRKAESDTRLERMAMSAVTRDMTRKDERDADRILQQATATNRIRRTEAWTGAELNKIDVDQAQAEINNTQKKIDSYEKLNRAVENVKQKEIDSIKVEKGTEEYQLQRAEIEQAYAEMLDGNNEKLATARGLLEEQVEKKKELADASFVGNYLRGMRSVVAEFTNLKKATEELGSQTTSTFLEGTTNSVASALGTITNPDNQRIKDLQLEVQKLETEKKQTEADIAAIQTNTSKTPEEVAQLADKKTKLNDINNQLDKQKQALGEASNAWTAFSQSMKNVMKTILDELNKYIAKLLVVYAMKKLASIGQTIMGGGGEGNAADEIALANMNTKSEGGMIPLSMGKAGVDSVPVLAMPGEMFIRKEAVDYYGADKLLALNSMKLQKFAEGGVVGRYSGGSSTSDTAKQPYQITLVNVADPTSVPKMTGDEVINIVSFDAAKKGAVYKTIRGVLQA